MKVDLIGSYIIGAFFPIKKQITPAPPVGLAAPFGYTAMSAETTIPSLPSHDLDSIQLKVLNNALVLP